MTAFALNYAIRNTHGALKGNLGWLFTMYYLHSDQMLRCFPSNETLKEETGIKHDGTLQKQRDQLIAMKALILVPIDKRLEEKEKELHPRRYVYQITGVIELKDGTVVPTVHINSPEILATHAKLLEDLGFDSQLLWRAFGDAFQAEKPKSKKKSNPAKNEGLILQKLQVAKSEDEVVKEKEEVVEVYGASAADTLEEKPNTSGKTPKPRKENRIFNGIAFTAFGIDTRNEDYQRLLANDGLGGRIGRIEKRLKKLYPNISPEDIFAFFKHYRAKFPNADMPRDPDKYLEHFMAYKNQAPATNIVAYHAPAAAPVQATVSDAEQAAALEVLLAAKSKRKVAS